MWYRAAVSAVILLSLLLPVQAGDREDRLIVHEWGTFTTLQNDAGHDLFGINIDDEPVPEFVHNLEPFILNTPVLSHDYWLSRQKGAPRSHPQVSMRLETPVIYFYPPANAKLPLRLDVQVKFRGGWLTEFYPNADVQLPGAEDRKFDFTNLSPSTVGELNWRNLEVGTSGKGPETRDNVWLAPRRVAAVNVTNNEQETERFLFYRGVAQQTSALRARTSSKCGRLTLEPTFQNLLPVGTETVIRQAWLMEARADGSSAFRTLGPMPLGGNRPQQSVTVERRFSESDFNAENAQRLEQEMHQALVADGLYADEATALLSTWQRAYFASPGLRLFYLVPRVWTDHTLPLTISGNPDITRVMIGRIELISDPQRAALEKLAKADGIGPAWLDQLDWESPARKKLMAGSSNFGDLGVKIPPHFQLYLSLGRFRNALMLAEDKQRGSRTGLTRFIEEYQLQPFRLTKK